MNTGAKIGTKRETEKKVCNGCIEVCNGCILFWMVRKMGVTLRRKSRVVGGHVRPSMATDGWSGQVWPLARKDKYYI